MDLNSLEQKISHARSVNHSLPDLPFNIVTLLKRGIGNSDTFLIYIDLNGKRVEFSYRDFYEMVLDTARFYQSQNLQIGDKIATISHNHWHTVVQYFAAWFCGLVVVPVNLSEDDHRIEYILKTAEVKLALVRDNYLDRIQKICSIAGLDGIQIVPCGEDIN